MGSCSAKHFNYENALYIETLTIDGRAVLERCIVDHHYMDCMTKTIIRKIIPRTSLHNESEFVAVLHKIQMYNPRHVARILHKKRTRNSIYVYLPDYGNTDLFSHISNISKSLTSTSIFTEACVLILKTVAQAIVNLHDIGIVHGDIKMENVMFYKENPVLIDFDGATRIPCRNRVRLAATPEYMAPEKVQKGKIRFANDVWSFGVTMYTCFEGFVPFTRQQLRTCNITDSFDPVFTFTPESIRPMIRSMFTIDHTLRPTMNDVLLELQAHASSGSKIFEV